jgi:hypothetical protein
MVKGDGGAVVLTENPDALRRWMLVGAEITKIIRKFEESISDDKDEFVESFLSIQIYISMHSGGLFELPIYARLAIAQFTIMRN